MTRQEQRDETVQLPRWQPPIDVRQYNRHPELTQRERDALSQAVTLCAEKKWVRIPTTLKPQLTRLLQPLEDILAFQGNNTSYGKTAPVHLVLREMHERSTSYWAWSQEDWQAFLTSAFTRFSPTRCSVTSQQTQRQLMLIAYLLGPHTDFFLPLLRGERSSQPLAWYLFGKERVQETVNQVHSIMSTWGFETGSTRRHLATTIAEVLLVNRSPYLEDLPRSLLANLRETMAPYKRGCIDRLSKALAHLGIIDSPLPPPSERKKVLPEHGDTEGIAPEWVEWCFQWFRFSDLSPRIRRAYLNKLLRVGRWLAATHPDVTIPHQWTTLLAAEYVAFLDQMKIGDFTSSNCVQREKLVARNAPLAASSKDGQLIALRTFFREIQEEPHNVPRRFDPGRVLRTPRNIKNLIGPSPRDLNPLLWARLVHAAHELTEEDLPCGPHGVRQYPLTFVRAVANVWVYSGLRADEITRLSLGCIRWQYEEVTVQETGEVLPKETTCFLTVPVNKTTTSFQKPVNSIVGHRIAEWEQMRASGQPSRIDRKTGMKVDYLFSHRGHTMGGRYLNDVIIPMLCRKAGVPSADERGMITSHRARATVATMLYNAPEGLSLWELMQWLGHKDPKTTQFYARIKPTKLAVAYTKAERNSQLVEALVDTKADAHGDVKIYYVLGDQGLCGNPDWALCQYRMACIKCPFFVPKDRMQLITSSKTVKRFMEVVQLTDEELVAVQDDADKLEDAVLRTQHLSPPTVLRRRAKGSTHRGIPLTVLSENTSYQEEANSD